MDFGQTGAALEDQRYIGRRKSLEDHAAEIILFDQAWGESRLLGGKPDRLAQLVGRLFVPADRHAQASPFQTTPQRRATGPRLARRGIQGIGLLVAGSARSSLRSRVSTMPSRSSRAPIRRIVPLSP